MIPRKMLHIGIDALDPLLSQKECKPTGFCQLASIRLQPTRLARIRQPPVANHYVDAFTRRSHFHRWNHVSRAGGENAPRSAVAVDLDNTDIG